MLRPAICSLILFAFLVASVYAGPLDETRCCINPVRTADGSIKRRADVVKAFKRNHPCPITGESRGACAGWEVDHVIPLACGGKDEVSNMQWLPESIKSAAGASPKDRWERKVYCSPQELLR